MTTFDMIITGLCLTICLEILLYKRRGARFKRGVSLLAYLILVAVGGLGLMTLTGDGNQTLNAYLVNPLALLACWLYYTRGNISYHCFKEGYSHD